MLNTLSKHLRQLIPNPRALQRLSPLQKRCTSSDIFYNPGKKKSSSSHQKAPHQATNMDIQILITGGTFDKEYNELDGSLFFKQTHLPEMLTLGRCQLPIKIRTLMMMDSTDMSDTTREVIAQQCLNSTSNKIIVTHGTDTMVETAKIIAEHVTDKTIILTGAMIPYTFGSSDGLFNLGCSLAYLQTLPKNVYISMNGQYFTWDNCKKNKALGQFETIQSP